MTSPPEYFERIRSAAHARWDQLEADPDLAGPWHLLFKQIQRPRHVLSELLQNAEDAGASEARASIVDNVFVFEHNGEDFSGEQFESLCRFGHSNKRVLHTIGFRGIGFKSTFSLGDSVFLHTPTLSVRFDRERFSEPACDDEPCLTKGTTRVTVPIKDHARHDALLSSLTMWRESPLSLLFFRSLRSLTIENDVISWISLGEGPIGGSEWMGCGSFSDEPFLVVRSDAEPFPEESLAEIREERNVGLDDDVDFPPCSVEIALGGGGRLHVVLPTDVEPDLPFAVNAPFIQDPARTSVKDPMASPTNRWLLSRVGELAASSMLAWLGSTHVSLAERADAYRLMPSAERTRGSVVDDCGTVVKNAFARGIEGRDVLLTHDGTVVKQACASMVPGEIHRVWEGEEIVSLIERQGLGLVAGEIGDTAARKLSSWGLAERITRRQVLDAIAATCPPRPGSRRQLLELWVYVAQELEFHARRSAVSDYAVVPVQGEDVLHRARDVVRLGKDRMLDSDDDWRFLGANMRVMDPNWQRFFSDENRRAKESDDDHVLRRLSRARRLLEELDLHSASSAAEVFDRAARSFFDAQDIELRDAVRMAQIGARLGVPADDSFRYVATTGELLSSNDVALVDDAGDLDGLLPADYLGSHLLHDEYTREFRACSPADWAKWVDSGNAGLSRFPRPCEHEHVLRSARQLEKSLGSATAGVTLTYPWATGGNYSSQLYFLVDFDFSREIVQHWRDEDADSTVWPQVVRLLAAGGREVWQSSLWIEMTQTTTSGGNIKRIKSSDPIPATWVRRLRSTMCLRDELSIPRLPEDLLVRTDETEPLRGTEHFVESEMDTRENRPFLVALGVQDSPASPDKLLDRLRVLAEASDPPVTEVAKWYKRLDLLLERASTEHLESVTEAFANERLVLTDSNEWVQTSGAFLDAGDDEAEGLPLVLRDARNLAMWRRIGVAEHPTLEHALEWIGMLTSGGTLGASDRRYLDVLLRRYPRQVWSEHEHWVTMADTWSPVDDLEYSLCAGEPAKWQSLHRSVLAETADCRLVPEVMLEAPPFSDLARLGAVVEYRLDAELDGQTQLIPSSWLSTFGSELSNVALEDDGETERVRGLARRAAAASVLETKDLQVLPCINGTPAGTPVHADVAWLGCEVLVCTMAEGKRAKRLPEEVGREFGRRDITNALAFSYDRPEQRIRSYLRENFEIEESSAILVRKSEESGEEPSVASVGPRGTDDSV